MVELSFAWATRFRRLIRDYERYPSILANLNHCRLRLPYAQNRPLDKQRGHNSRLRGIRSGWVKSIVVRGHEEVTAFVWCEACEGLFDGVAKVRDRASGLGPHARFELGKGQFVWVQFWPVRRQVEQLGASRSMGSRMPPTL